MPVWLVLGVQSRARFMVVNCSGVDDLLKVLQYDGIAVVVPMGCCVACGAELATCCCHRKAPPTMMISNTGMPILIHRRVLEFIWFLLLPLPSRAVIPRQGNTFDERYKTKEEQAENSCHKYGGKDIYGCKRVRCFLHVDAKPLLRAYILPKDRSNYTIGGSDAQA